MPTAALSSIGLLMAAAMSITNVLTDVARKRALQDRDLVTATFWIRTAVTSVFGIVLLYRLAGGAEVVIRDGGPLFGIESIHLAPIPTFLIYLTINVLLITAVMWLYFRA